ncbi:tRNA1(Val) (adenine(37)-N6)-methyltransferase [Mesoplasma lactucae]|uniref:SAM-dependent methyltransferase n=1 Tax=Mesoplasma lactucae ATCC 49193 TaxID=81460 RepID=A0A291IS50_9MOLU|nr:tRNA1(Val) (adenine(37)-N6)-methyltransferase [Mesoplasma lactucae]ATG97692.1 SAM-dependent methyltransferase [Mesoplasma lactucae ATCC 49193]ATZ19842.1 methyltransferase [Mesoplasma lactucae ATCC 49193]MCL8216705.1 tRNA1(Val) (adenine(37)-N6)-methyltransferase [Mesoplasma lactucae ATCC 49193]
MKELNNLLGYKDRHIYQDTEMFNFTLDSILLARFVSLNAKKKRIVDFGTNNAVIPLIISKYTNANITGVEIQPKAVELAKENVDLNELQSQIKIVQNDIADFAKENVHQFDVVICNPPFFEVGEKTKTREISQEVVNARHETLINLDGIVKSAGLCLNNGGTFAMVHRAERIGEIIELFNKYKITPKKMQFIYSKPGYDAKTVLIEGEKQGNKGMTILPAIIAHNVDETYTQQVLDLFRD